MYFPPEAYAAFSAVTNASSKTLFRSLMKQSFSTWHVIFINNLGGALILLLILGVPSLADIPFEALILLLLNSFIWTTTFFLEMNACAHLDAAVGVVFGSLRYVLLSIASVVFFGEAFSLYTALGVLLVALGVLISSELGNLRFRKGAYFRLLGILCCNAAILMDKHISTMTDPVVITISAMLLPSMLLLLLVPRKLTGLSGTIVSSRYRILLTPIFQAFGYLTYVTAFQRGGLIMTASLGQLTIVFTLIFSVIFLKEYSNLERRIVGSLLCIIGSLVVSFW